MKNIYLGGETASVGDLIAYKSAGGQVHIGTVASIFGDDNSLASVNNEEVILANSRLICGVSQVS